VVAGAWLAAAPAVQAAAPPELELSITSRDQATVRANERVALRVHADRPGRVNVNAAVLVEQTGATRGLRFTRAGARTVRIPLDSAARRAVARCGRVPVTAAARGYALPARRDGGGGRRSA
jgi:hypothetical protein